MRLLITADLHFNHKVSRPLAEEVIGEINSAGGDALVVVGDTAIADSDSLEQCLSLFRCNGPKLLVAGNHELWTQGPDSHALFQEQLPRRVRAMGWQWLETEPAVFGDVAIVGSVGWYDYSFAAARLGIPRRFYENKVSPGAAERLEQFASLLEHTEDISSAAREIVARWNDGKFVKLHRSDQQFLQERLANLRNNLTRVGDAKTVVAAVHHVPFRELLPPSQSNQWDFTKAYLGSERIGKTLLEFPNVSHVFCGHSHLAREADVGHIKAVNIGSGYRWKTFRTLDLPG